MAQQEEQTSSNSGNVFNKSLIKDLNDSSLPPGTWSHARNATPISPGGDITTLGNEPANLRCPFVVFPYTVIGVVHKIDSLWVIFSTDNTHSEIGIFDDDACSYTPIVSPNSSAGLNKAVTDTSCLNFNTDFLITGACKQNFDCTWSVYFADSNNPDRVLNLNNPPLVCVNTSVPGDPTCYTCVPTGNGTPGNPYTLDCNKLRIASLMTVPCIDVEIGTSGGNLLNGSYFVVIAYVLNGQRVTDYFPPSNIQPIFSHLNSSGSLLININVIDQLYFTEFELVLVSIVNQQAKGTRMGIFSTRSSVIHIDNIDPTLTTVPIELLPIITPEYEKSDAIYTIANYLVRVSPTTNFDFNYQPLANGINVKWVAVEYPADYYKKGGNKTSYLRDEVYALFIRWIYDTGVKSSSYHIPGRAATPYDTTVTSQFPMGVADTLLIDTKVWQTYNTATIDPLEPLGVLPDGGVEIAAGYMGYWESTESYPDDKPTIWNASSHAPGVNLVGTVWPGISSFPSADLCGEPIRHHKMPDQSLPGHKGDHFRVTSGNAYYRFLGIRVENIQPPVDNNGKLITNIVGYEILRGTREGNKTIIAKGMVNNTRAYELTPGVSNSRVGIYQNYPYNPLGADPTLTTNSNIINGGGFGATIGGISTTPATRVSSNVYTFHSPDTQFKNPFLSVKELKLYGEIGGPVTGNFSEVPNHPKEKLLGDLAFFIAAAIGIGEATLSLRGQRQDTLEPITNHSTDFVGAAGADLTALTSGPVISAWTTAQNLVASNTNSIPLYSLGNLIALMISGQDTSDQAARAINLGFAATSSIDGTTGGVSTRSKEWTQFDYQDPLIKIFSGVMTFTHYWTLGTDTALRLIESIVPYQQYAYQYQSHGWYTNFSNSNVRPTNYRRILNNANYLENQLQDFGSAYKVNNLYRGRAVVIDIDTIQQNIGGDNTVQSIGSAAGLTTGGGILPPDAGILPNPNWKPGASKYLVTNNINTHTTSYYGALKVELENQYGLMGSVREIPISCPFNVSLVNTPTIFGGDTYVSRYTEKNSFFYFYDWLYKQPDGYEWDYRLRFMTNYPRFWADFTRFDAMNFLTGLFAGITTLFSVTGLSSALPDGKACLDYMIPKGNWLSALGQLLSFEITNAYFYLFQSGIRDFYVESEINTDLRDWGDINSERHYDGATGPGQYTDLPALFDPSIIKSGNYFKYDYSLSIGRLFSNFISWGTTQDVNVYDPLVAYSCFRYFPKRIIYSLPQNLELVKDYWRVFLPNNYQNFRSPVTAIKTVNKSGAFILFESDAPVMFQGTDQLQTSLGTKLTIGDGGLFTQPLQNVVNTEQSLEYGACQNKLSVINTPMGIFWMCENQGKIFSYTNTINDIGYSGLKFWIKKYLPYTLTKDFPSYPLTDNPVAGIGCQAVYDNQIELIYFCKKDFSLLPVYQNTGRVVYYPLNATPAFSDVFVLDGITPYKLGDPKLFQNSSWTLSYDPKEKVWLSYHDWFPNLIVPSKNNFLTIITNLIGQGEFWRHNFRVDLFCNYYGIDYPFELEYVAATGITVNTLRSIEFYLEVYKYDTNGYNKFQFLDASFDQAVVYNTEQVSGVLKLNDTPKNNPFAGLLYPIINTTFIDILYIKKEQKYRFNQFFDITDDRGEFTTAERFIWLWDPNGYTRTLNSFNLNYNKSPFQRKKFRHYLTKVILTKLVSGNQKFIMKTSINKDLQSKR